MPKQTKETKKQQTITTSYACVDADKLQDVQIFFTVEARLEKPYTKPELTAMARQVYEMMLEEQNEEGDFIFKVDAMVKVKQP